MSLQQQPAISLRLGAISKPALTSFNRVSSVSFPIKQSMKQQPILVAAQTNKKCPFFKEPIFATAQTHKNPFFVKCSNSVLEAPYYDIYLYDSIDGRQTKYREFNDEIEKAVSEIISMTTKQQIGSCASALNQLQNTSGKLIPPRVLDSLVRYLERNKRYQDALEVYEWMINVEKREKFVTRSHLYLIAKVHGVSSAEEYLLNLPDTLKNKELYNVLLVRYAVERNVIKAESLFDEMRHRGYACYAAPFNVMMILYKEIERYDKIWLMISKMMEENISLDAWSYDIWLWVCRTQECLDKFLEHLKQREINLDILGEVLNDVFFMYSKELKQAEKAEECVKLLESGITNEWREYKWVEVEDIVEKYWFLGKTGDIHRVWETHVDLRESYYDSNSHGVIYYLIKLHDVEGAEKMYDEWVSHGPTNLLTSKANYFLEQIVDSEGLSEKVEPFFDKMIKSGIMPNSDTWNLLAKNHVKMRRISEALSCLRKCFEGNSDSSKCNSYRFVIRDFIRICEEEGDIASRDDLFNLLSEVGCKVEAYKVLATPQGYFHLGKEPIFATHTPNEIFLFDSVDGRMTDCREFDDETKKAVSEIISMMRKQQIGCASALNQLENTSGELIPRRLLQSLVRRLEHKECYRDALEVYDWMNNREKRYGLMTPAETNTHLYLIAKVHGVSSAEEYFLNLPDTLKNKELYNVLLVRYAVERNVKKAAVQRNVIKAESLFDEMRNRGYACYATPFNVMMMLYKKIKHYDKIRLMISKMMEENISLDALSYNIWLCVCGTQECLDKLLDHLKQREINLDTVGDVLGELFFMYLKEFKQTDKAEECVKLLESGITNEWREDKWRDVENLVEKYWFLGKTGEIHRVWETHVGLRESYYDSNSHGVTFYLLKLHDVEGAEKMYDEWVSHGPTDLLTSKANFFLKEIVKVEGLSEKVEPFFDKMIKLGITPNSDTWEILAENHVKMRRIPEALSCLHKCFEGNSDPRTCSWYRYVICDLIKICDEEGDMASKDALFNLLSEVGCKVEAYKLLATPQGYLHLGNETCFIEFGSKSSRLSSTI